jgi:CheY-like chemotaxis protein
MPKLDCILLVDDDQATNYLNQLLLKRLDVAKQVLVALNGQDALDTLQARYEQASEASSTLVLLDMKMPVMDGFEFLGEYAKLPLAQQSIVVVMLTTSLHPQDVKHMEQLDIGGFMNKPLTAEKLEGVLQQHFQWELPLLI